MVHNGSSQGAWILPTDPHQEFRELCALSTTGELTAEDWYRLTQHLAGCADCRKVKAQYERVAEVMIPVLASGAHSGAAEDSEDDLPSDSWSIVDAEARLMKSLEDEPAPSRMRPALETTAVSKWHYIRRLTIAALVVLGIGGGGYRLGMLKGHGPAKPEAPLIASVQPAARGSARQSVMSNAHASAGVEVLDDRTAKLEAEIQRSHLELEDVQDQLRELQSELAQRDADLDQLRDDRTNLNQQLAQAQASTQALESKLAAIGNQTAQDTVQSLTLKAQINDLTTAIAGKDSEIAHQQELLQRDSDIRNLISARNLYIAEIYDVDKNDVTQKPFGRVFYTKDKSLIFYGYDLDQQKGIPKDVSFQAWGRRGSGPKGDINLGLLYQDDSNRKRWVLKFNDAKTISQLDALFITIEPQGGSAKPSSKPLLFTYLHLDPNHP